MLRRPFRLPHYGAMRRADNSFCPGFEQLRMMPQILRGLVSGLTEDEARWKPAPARWSVLEVLGHLAHVEAHGFRARVLKMLSEDNPQIANYDPDAWAAAGAYDSGSLEDAHDAFARERGASLALLESLSPEALARPGIHAELGAISIGALLHEWPFHDLGHLRQIAELVRTVKFYPHMGAWRKFYNVQP
jgi:hypothetical protein